MKKLILIFCLFVGAGSLLAQSFEARVIQDDFGYLAYQLRETTGTNPPSTTKNITDITFEIRWDNVSYPNLDLAIICTNYNIEDEVAGKRTSGSYDYRVYNNFSVSSFASPENWTQNTWYTIVQLEVTDPGSGTVDLEVAPAGFGVQSINFTYDADGNGSIEPGENFTPTINGFADDFPYPTIVWDLVWVGGTAGFTNDWFFSSNWTGTCGGPAPSGPNSLLNIYVGSASYPLTTNISGTMQCANLRIGSGGQMTVPVTNGNLAVSGKTILDEDGTLSIAASGGIATLTDLEFKDSGARAQAQLIINPGSQVTVNGPTTLTAAQQIQVLADATGVGSFIDNGTINHGTSGSALVQTYLANAATPGNFFMHLVGPTVHDPTYTGPGTTGVFLSAFDVASLATYAYEWVEANASANGWSNVSATTTPVPTAKGLAQSTDDATNYTMNMTGQLITGAVATAAALGHSNNNLELISNPYPSAVDWDVLQPTNSSVVNTTFYIWNPASGVSGNYGQYTQGTGGTGTNGVTKDIQVGQGFFVETLSSAPFNFSNSDRLHSNTAFLKDGLSNLLKIRAEGNNFADELIIYFKEGATYNYEWEIEAEKWYSMIEEATEIWTVSADNMILSQNALPPMGTEMVTVPMSFKNGTEGEYSISGLHIDSFEPGTEIYLEDLVTGEPWHNLVQEPTYTFTATPDDPQERFLVHFFGPTGIEEPGAQEAIRIYSHKEYAYIMNDGSEEIEEFVVYDMMGHEVMRGTLPSSTLNKIYVGDNTAYYVVQVITKNRSYNGKVLITK